MALLRLSGVGKKGKDKFIVQDISFEQKPLERIAIAGETGSGKTTLLKMIGGLVQVDEGRIEFEDRKIIGPDDQLLPGHPGTAFLSQHFELRNNYFVHEILEYANQLPGEEAMSLYRICRIEKLLTRRTNELSGGERQRIALARLLTGRPRLLLLDEPYSNLDALHKNIIKTVIDDIADRLKISCILVSHDAGDMLSWADKILVIKDGKLVQSGKPQDIYNSPVNEYCAGLFGSYNNLDWTSTGDKALNNHNKILRPEQLKIVAEGEHKLSGILQRKIFWGSYFILEVLVDKHPVLVQSNGHSFNPGDKIFLSYQAPG